MLIMNFSLVKTSDIFVYLFQIIIDVTILIKKGFLRKDYFFESIIFNYIVATINDRNNELIFAVLSSYFQIEIFHNKIMSKRKVK
jgi:hypothetical protein